MFNDEKVDGKELVADQNCKELARMFLGGKGIIEKTFMCQSNCYGCSGRVS